MIRIPYAAVAWAVPAIVASSCATTMNVSSHVREGLNFGQYRTYDWGPADALPTGDPRLDQDAFFKDRVQGAVEKGLAARGVQLTAAGASDLLIHYHAHTETRIDVNRTEREYGYCQGAACDGWVIEYEVGTLVLDIVDARTNQLIWRGWAQDSVDDVLENRDRMGQKIDEAVSRMLVTFPGRN